MRYLAVLLFVWSLTANSAQSLPEFTPEYTPQGLYDVQAMNLNNGLQVLYNPRHIARNVAIRLVVDVGFQDFECGTKETPHFLEHLIFSGTDRYSEEQLEERIADLGGSWNATTRDETTTYTLDVYSENAAAALQLLYNMISDSRLTDEAIEKSRKIVKREAGGSPSPLIQWLRSQGVGRDAYSYMLEHFGLGCAALETADNVSTAQIKQAYQRFYQATNMTLILVGDFNAEELPLLLADNFAQLPGHAPIKHQRPVPADNTTSTTVSGTLAPLRGSDAQISLAVATSGLTGRDFLSLSLLRRYLDRKLYKSLRLEQSLSYAPEAYRQVWREYGFFFLSADVEVMDIEQGIKMLNRELDKLYDGGMDEQALQEEKQRALLRFARGLEANADYADYYEGRLAEYERWGHYLDIEQELTNLGQADIHKVLQSYFAPQRRVVVMSKPTLSEDEFHLMLGVMALLLLIILFRVLRRLTRKKQKNIFS